MFGVYDLLEQLGVRWYFPGELGEEIPQTPTIRVSWLENAENPDFILRDMWLAYADRPGEEKQAYRTWQRHNRMGGVHAQMGHALGYIISPQEYGETHPEYFPLIDGERLVPQQAHNWQPCTSNPEVVRIAAEKARAAFDRDPTLWCVSLSPNDGNSGWCECDNCVALDPPEYRDDPRRGKARRMLVFANAVADLLAQTHPDRRVCFYAYAPTVEPPTDLRAHPQVAVAIAHYGAVGDNLRPIADPTSPRNAAFIPLLDGWGQVTDEIFAREYWTSLLTEMDGIARSGAAWALPEDIPWYRDHHVIGFSSEALPIWGSCGLNFYLAAKLMWDADADVDAILDDYFTGMYGPAATPMREYFETIRDLCRERYLTQDLFGEEDFARLRGLLDAALAAAETDRQQARVQLTVDHFDYVQLVRRMSIAADEASIAAVNAFVAEHPDTLAFDQTMHRSMVVAPRITQIPPDLRYVGPDVVAASDAPVPAEALAAAPAIRAATIYLIVPEPGSAFSVTVQPHKMGRYLDPTAVSLRTPAGEEVASANVGPTGEEIVRVEAADQPWYLLLVNAGANAARITCDARTFVLATDSPHFVGPTPRIWFLPETGTAAISVVLNTETPGETALVTVWDPSGAEAGHVQTALADTERLQIDLAGHPEGAWSIRVDKVPDGYIEDARVDLLGVQPYLATDPARLVKPAGQ